MNNGDKVMMLTYCPGPTATNLHIIFKKVAIVQTTGRVQISSQKQG